ncbi:MAG: hypothetical protein ACF8AM_13405 [Rhodopirellula sp. JB055]|uniref:hypothetical protein n=1 Tax=Rhodopirellula sp. JB055 TaxID=3342846 RepID=UPI00370CC984
MNSVGKEPKNAIEILGGHFQSASLIRQRPELERNLSGAGSKDAVLLIAEHQRPVHRRTRDPQAKLVPSFHLSKSDALSQESPCPPVAFLIVESNQSKPQPAQK